MSRFHVKHEELLKILGELGIERPTEIQEAAIPEILSGKHVLLIAPTGIGKTEAAMIPILERIAVEKPKGIACLYVTPLRALNRDMMRRLTEFGNRLGITIGVRHGDTAQAERQKQSRTPPQILITTPETFQILFLGQRLRSHLKNVKWVVIDEIHELAEDERGAQLAVGLERLADIAGEFQRIGISATVGDPETIGAFLVGAGRNVRIVKVSPIKEIELEVESPIPTDTDENLASALHTDAKHVACMKRARELIEQHRSTLFFVNTRDTAEALGVRYRIWDERFPIGVHHGSLSKDVRMQMEDDFKKERLRALICTSSLELGIDIGSADFTIQFNSPRQVTRITQRVGRSGHRIGEKSVGRVIATDYVDILESAVICRKAMNGELERFRIRSEPLAVLSNQIAAMAMTSGSFEPGIAYRTIRRAYPFRSLERGRFDDVIEAMKRIGMISQQEDKVRKTRKTMSYFFDNISMIPDEKTFRIREISSRGIIGTLDESFVATSLEPYSTFVARGRAWQVVEVKEDEILVEEIKEIAAPPSWIGEEIPIPFSIAQEVGALRASEEFKRYPMDKNAIAECEQFSQRHKKKGFPIPNDREIRIETGDRLVIMHACFGTKVNATIAKLVGSLISARLGESIGIESNAYSVILRLPVNIGAKDVEKILRDTKPEALEPLLRLTVKSSGIFKWHFLHVAKKFGVIEKGADYKTVNLGKIMEIFEGTIVFEEALNRTLFEELDIDTTKDVLANIQANKIAISSGNMSPLGTELMQEQRELMMPRTADRSILMALKNRLLEEKVILHCLKCGAERRTAVRALPEKGISCHNCGGVMLAVVRPYAKDDLASLKKGRRGAQEEAAIKRLYKSASLVMANGKKAVLALVARGVGPDTAARILQRPQLTEEDFLRDVLAAEIQYARTKRFWD
ncbi:MAG: DEAD/DEAH box helicase [Thermoplasmata archaeon]